MKRQTKSAAALSLAVALALGAAPASFAAPGWRQDEKGTWTYYQDVSLMPNSSKTGGSAQSAKGPGGGGEAGAQSEGEQTEEKGDGKGDGAQEYTYVWKYVGKPEEAARNINKSEQWFQVIPDEVQEDGAYENNEKWYRARYGQLCMNQFMKISGVTYAYDSEGERLSGLKFIEVSPDDPEKIVKVFNGDDYYYDNIEDFIIFYNSMAAVSQADGSTGTRHVYTFLFDENGVMQTNKTSVNLDGTEYNAYFVKSDPGKGRGYTGVKDNKVYVGGIRMVAEKDNIYEVVISFRDGTFQRYSFPALIEAIQLKEDREKRGYYYDINNTQGFSFQYLIEQRMSPVDRYYIVDDRGEIQTKLESKDGHGIYFSFNGAEITELYKQQ